MEEIAQTLLDLFLALSRVGTALMMLPVTGPQSLGAFGRLLLAVPFAYFAVATGSVSGAGDLSAAMMIKEACIGLLLGFVWALPFHALQSVGHIVDFQSGLTFAQSLDPLTEEQSSISANLFFYVFAAIFMTAGGMMMMIDTLVTSYAIWPVQSFLPRLSAATLLALIYETNGLFTLSILFAAPAAAVLLLIEFAVGVVSSTAQQLGVEQFILPLKIWLSWAVLLLCLPYIVQRVTSLLPELVYFSQKVLEM
jgi:type III secretion protein T